MHRIVPSTPYVLEFIEQVKTRSGGNITIEPIWDAGADTTPVFEQGVVKIVTEGQYDLGLAASRAFDSQGITSFQALQGPFLITNDALSEAVAASDIGTRMLDSLSSAGAVGLALWPEDLRHPFSVIPGKPVLSPEDFEGATVRVVPSEVSHMLIETLGGSQMFSDGDYQAAESGLRQGFSLTGLPIATGNVVFFPKFQVLFANGAAFEKLSEAQRTVLRGAATATQEKAIAEHPSEVDAAAAWCTDGGTVVMASEEQVAAFEAAAIPVFEMIEQDPLNAELIASIRELKAKTAPSAGASACAPEVRQPNPEPTTETQVWSQGLPPNGTWQAERTIDDFLPTGMLRSVAEREYAGIYTITFKDGKYTLIFEGLRGQLGRCEADYELVEEDILRLTYDPSVCDLPPEDMQWRIDEDGLHLHLVASNGGPPDLEWSPVYEAKPWQKVEEWSEGLPPNGVWRVELTADDFVRMGVMLSKAKQMAGTYTWTLQDGHYVLLWQGGSGESGNCIGNYVVVEDFVRLTSTTDDCPDEVEDFRWRLDEDGLHVHLIAARPIPFIEMKANFEAKPWQKVEEWSQGLPPNGVWQAEITTDDFVRMGVSRSVAETEWAGVYTITFKDGKYVMIWEGLQGQLGRCQADYELVEEDIVRLTNTTDPSECSLGPEDIQWRIDDEGLHLHLVPQNSGLVDVEATAFYEAKVWQKVADQ